jgi:hypothetical protein
VLLFISIMSVSVAAGSQDDWTKQNAWQEDEIEDCVKKEVILNYFALFWVSLHISFAMRFSISLNFGHMQMKWPTSMKW